MGSKINGYQIQEDQDVSPHVAEINIKKEKEENGEAVPIASSYNDHIRPLLDAVDKLRLLKVTTKEGIQLPTIVVVGDQSSGKSSVLESLAGVELPRGQGICTRVPLIMRLQHFPSAVPEIFLEFNGKTVRTDETRVAEAIRVATDEIAGTGKGISNTPLTLVVKKNGVPDLTMIDLPGITRVPVHGQPEDIYEQIAGIIREYITPQESIILNVLSATVDFPTCESIRMSQQVDNTGVRTLAVVTKSDKAPEGLLEKVIADDVNIGLGYVCVRNRIGDESYEEARKEEVMLFQNHPLLSKIDKSMVGIPILAQKLTQIQATIMARCLPDIFKKINEKLNASISEMNRLPKILSSPAEALTAFVGIIGSVKESLQKILIRGEYDEYLDDHEMHSAARLVEMLNQFSSDLHVCPESERTDFLMEEILVVLESRAIQLPNFLPHTAFMSILQKKIEGISRMPIEFMEKVWAYIEKILTSVLLLHSENYHQLQQSARRAGHKLISKMKDQSINWVTEIVEMEKMTDYTCNPEYLSEWNKLMVQQDQFMEKMSMYRGLNSVWVPLEGIGSVEIRELKNYEDNVIQQAFDLKMRITSYWKIVLRRLVDTMALHLLYSVKNLVNKEMEKEIISELIGGGGEIERLLEESPSVASRHDKLNMSIKLLGESKNILGNIMDKIATY